MQSSSFARVLAPLANVLACTSLACIGLACSPVPAADDEAGVTTSPGTSESEVGDESTTTTTTTVTSEATATTDEPDTTDLIFIPDDVPGEMCMCDPFAQDCPEGEKCVPYSHEGGGSWDCVKCVPVLGDQAPGEACVSTGPFESTDDCDATSWCFTLGLEGVCFGFCTGSLDQPECPPGSHCLLNGDGTINLCISTCDPLLQDCSAGEGCYWTGSGTGCLGLGEDLPVGSACEALNDCAIGLQCTDASALPACEGVACCTPFCDLTDGEGGCAALPGTACVTVGDPNNPDLGTCVAA